MKAHRVWGMTLRYLYAFRHNLDKVADAFYWPTIDILLWGLTSTYLTSLNEDGGSQAFLVVLSGLVLWLVVWRGQGEITLNALEEFWERNLINIFASPLKFHEWIASFLLLGLVKAAVSFLFAIMLAWLLFSVNIFSFGFLLVPFALLLIMTGWWFGFLIAGLILRFGRKMQALAWTLIFAIAPFSAVYYPLSTLPDWAQTVGKSIPITYVFEGGREVIAQGTIDPRKLIISFGLNLLYLFLAGLFLHWNFEARRRKGFEKIS